MCFQVALNKLVDASPSHPPTIKALQTTKKLAFFSPPLVFKRRFAIPELKIRFIFSPPGKQSQSTGFELLFANHYTTNVCSIWLNSFQIPVVKLC